MEKNVLEKRIEELLLDLVACRSIVGSADEIAISNKVYQLFSEMEYWKRNPDDLKQLPFIGDSLGRSSVVVTLRGRKNQSKQTVILIGHTDTVGISDYGDLRPLATKPAELAEALKKVTLSLEAEKDLASEKWIFGRGVLDMKCGVAILMAILEDLSKDLDALEGNLVFAAVGDEEANSGGMLSFVPELMRMQQAEQYEYVAVIDTDYTAPRYEGDDHRYIYIGTVGKLMPSFYIVGKETHVGDPFNGLDPNQIAGAIINKINQNVAYSDVADGEVSLPPITLQQRDLKQEYSFQISKAVNLYFNYATHKSTPDEVIKKMIKAARDAFNDVVNILNERYDIFCKASRMEYRPLSWKSKVVSYNEMYEAVKAERGDALDRQLEDLVEKMLADPTIDERYFGQKIVEEVHGLWSLKEPVVIVYFSPPYYPHNFVKGNYAKDAKLLSAVDHVIKKYEGDCKLVSRKFYPYISDLSFVTAPKSEKIAALQSNMPAYGTKYNLPLAEMQALSLPVVNIGPFGKDAHQFTERIEKAFSIGIAPFLVYDTILELLHIEKEIT